MWINGQTAIVGSNPTELADRIEHSNTRGPVLNVTKAVASIGASPAPAGGADIWLAQFDPATRRVPIGAGENGGLALPHRNIVTALRRVGHWSGKAQTIALPDPGNTLRSAVFLQAGKGGVVLAAARN